MGPNGVAANILESRLGGYALHVLGGWVASQEFVAGVGSGLLSADRDVWTDCSLVRDEVSGVSCGGAGFFCIVFWCLLVSSFLGAFGFAST